MKNKVSWKSKIAFALILFTSFESICFSEDFPNYFREMVPANGDTTHPQSVINAALGRILKKLEIPRASEDEKSVLTTPGFFDQLETKVHSVDPGAKIEIGGGVVRSLLGYIYQKVFSAKSKNPNISTEEIIAAIGTKEKGVPSLKALGIASDFDIYIEHHDPAKFDKIKAVASDYINSAERVAGLRAVDSKVKWALVPIADVKDRKTQLDRATEQGGSTLDWLSYPIHGGEIGTPEHAPDIFKDVILGQYDYRPPTQAAGGSDKQVVRGLRPLLELPFLKLTPAGENQLGKELSQLILSVRSGHDLSQDALEQFEKMMRNARFEGGHNRFHISDQKIEKLAIQLSQAAKPSEKKLPLIPEFVMNQDPHSRGNLDRCDLSKDHFLTSKEDFESQYTDGGSIYHGTPSLDNMLCIIRNGLFTSNLKQGTAAFGPGAYSTQDKAIAEVYGIPLEFKLKDGVTPRVLNWNKVKSLPSFAKHLKGSDLEAQFSHLAKECDVDIIINDHILIQNTGVIALPKNIKDVIQLYSASVSVINPQSLPAIHTKEDANSTLRIVANYESIRNLGELMGIAGLPSPISLETTADMLLTNRTPIVRATAAEVLGSLRISNPDGRITRSLAKLLKDPDSSVQIAAIRGLGVRNQIDPQGPEVDRELIRVVEDQGFNPIVRATAAEVLGSLRTSNPDGRITRSLAKLLRDPDYSVRFTAIRQIRERNRIDPKDPEVDRELISVLEDQYLRTGVSMARKEKIPADKAISDGKFQNEVLTALRGRIPLGTEEQKLLLKLMVSPRLGMSSNEDNGKGSYADLLRDHTSLDPQTIHTLAVLLKDPQSKLDFRVFHRMGEIIAENEETRGSLFELLQRHNKPRVQIFASNIIASNSGKLSDSQHKFIKALIELVKNRENSEPRLAAAGALLSISPRTPEIEEVLVTEVKSFLKDPDPFNVTEAIRLFINLPDSNIPLMVLELLKHPDALVRESAATHLGRFESLDAISQVAVIERVEARPIADLSTSFIRSPLPSSVQFALIKLLRRPNWKFRRFAEKALLEHVNELTLGGQLLLVKYLKMKEPEPDELKDLWSKCKSMASKLCPPGRDVDYSRNRVERILLESSLELSALRELAALLLDPDPKIMRVAARILNVHLRIQEDPTVKSELLKVVLRAYNTLDKESKEELAKTLRVSLHIQEIKNAIIPSAHLDLCQPQVEAILNKKGDELIQAVIELSKKLPE